MIDFKEFLPKEESEKIDSFMDMFEDYFTGVQGADDAERSERAEEFIDGFYGLTGAGRGGSDIMREMLGKLGALANKEISPEEMIGYLNSFPKREKYEWENDK